MNIEVVAKTALTILTPYLAKAGEGIAKKAGDDLYNRANKLHKILKEKFKNDSVAQTTLSRIEEDPAKALWQDALCGILVIKMEQDSKFAERIYTTTEGKHLPSPGDTITQSINVSGHTKDITQIGKITK